MSGRDREVEALDRAILTVAQLAQEMMAEFEPIGSSGYYQIAGEYVDDLRAALRVWSEASQALMQTAGRK